MRRWTMALVVLAAACPTARAAGSRAEAAIAAAIRGARNDADRAVKLLAAGKAATDDDVAAALLAEAVERGLRAHRATRAVQAAAAALDLLDTKSPRTRPERRDKRLAVRRLTYRHAPRKDKKTAGLDLLEALQVSAESAESAGQWTAAKELHREGYSVAYFLRSPLADLLAFRRVRATHFETVAREAKTTSKLLAAGRADAAAREKLLEMLVIELNDLPAAKAPAGESANQMWRTYLPLAGRDPATLSASAAGELARWYHEFLAPKASKFSQLRLLLAARACCRRAVEVHKADDAQRQALRKRLSAVEEQLVAYAMSPTAGGRGADVNLLRSIDPDRVMREGVWDSASGRLTTWPRRESYLRLPATVTGNYRLRLRFINRNHIPLPDRFRKFNRLRVSDKRKIWFKRLLEATPGVNVALPVGDRHVALSVLPGRGKTRGILAIVEPLVDEDDEDGDDPAQPATTQADNQIPNDAGPSLAETVTVEGPYIAREKVHQLDIAVFVELGVATIVVNLDEKPLIRWEGDSSRLVLDDIWPARVDRGSILLGGWRGPTAFNTAKVCNFSGQTAIDRPDKPQP